MRDLQTRLVIVEGIMGSGKSTTARCIATRLDGAGRPAQPVTETSSPHPVRATDGLAHWYQPWLDITPSGIAEGSLATWQTFVAAAQSAATAHVLDGQLFHGDLTTLFLMDAGSAAIVKYILAVEETVRPLRPLLVYFYQDDVSRAIRAIATERGEEWVKYQVNWKLRAPYSRRLGLEGLDGLIVLYRDYRALTDELYARLGLAKLAIENSPRAWPAYCQRIMQELLGGGPPEAI